MDRAVVNDEKSMTGAMGHYCGVILVNGSR
jgi:hypothetical protein